MELGRFDSVTRANEGVELELLDPVSGAKSGVVFTLYGADSAVHKQARKELDAQNRALGRALSGEEISAQTAEILARCTKGWRGLEDKGKPYLFDQEKAKALYLACPAIADSVATFVFTRANFFEKPSAS